jgi:hypothetical protein
MEGINDYRQRYIGLVKNLYPVQDIVGSWMGESNIDKFNGILK